MGLLRSIDWRTVAAVGLPLWAFLLGALVTRPAPEPVLARIELPEPPVPPDPPAPPEPDNLAPMPREIVVRTQVVAVPVAVPVVTPSEPVVVNAPPPEFRLPASELMPAERCKTFDTKVRFHAGLPAAAEEAKTSKKMLLVLHISGHFDDPGFT
ncbi:MAG TPA: hypothetical protein VGE74_31635 [Gemmata sp.]